MAEHRSRVVIATTGVIFTKVRESYSKFRKQSNCLVTFQSNLSTGPAHRDRRTFSSKPPQLFIFLPPACENELPTMHLWFEVGRINEVDSSALIRCAEKLGSLKGNESGQGDEYTNDELIKWINHVCFNRKKV